MSNFTGKPVSGGRKLTMADMYLDLPRWNAATRAERTAAHERSLEGYDESGKGWHRSCFEQEEDAKACGRPAG